MATKRPSSFWKGPIDLDKLLQDNFVTLTKQLQVKDVIPYLIQGGILLMDHREEILKCATKEDMAQELLAKVLARGNCTVSQFVSVLRLSGHEHLADMLEGKPNSKVTRTEGILGMTDSQLRELSDRLVKVCKEEVARHEGNTSLGGLKGYEMGDAEPKIRVQRGQDFVDVTARPSSLVVMEEAGRNEGTAFAEDWVGDQKVTSGFTQMYKLKLKEVKKDQTITEAIFDQLLWDPVYKPSFSKESLWRYMEQTQEEILFVLEGLDRLNPFSQEILQLIDKKLLPRATVIVTVTEANGA